MSQPIVVPNRDELNHAMAEIGGLWVECAASDFTSVARGKRVHADDFVSMAGCRLPSVVLGLTVTAGESDAVFGPILPTTYDDVRLVPDLHTLALRPGRSHEATVLCEPEGELTSSTGVFDASELSPRAALRTVLRRYERVGLRALVAPELELFLLQRQPDQPSELQAAVSHPASPVLERHCEAYSLERLTHFEPYFDELYGHCDALGIPVNGHAHESALGQFEVNFRPGDALDQADAVFRFKRLARELAARHGFLASFAAKPYLDQPGTGMHWHFSVQRILEPARGPLFASGQGNAGDPLLHFIAGLQTHAPAAMALFAPYDMSFDRIALSDASPSHASWGPEGRSLAFRIPASSPANRRVENRLPGGDANPYLTVATTLGLGLLGLEAAQLPQVGTTDDLALPRSLPLALDALERSDALRSVLGSRLVDAYVAIKRHEHAERAALAHPRQDWDLHHLIELA